jgi:hypothetical protein
VHAGRSIGVETFIAIKVGRRSRDSGRYLVGPVHHLREHFEMGHVASLDRRNLPVVHRIDHRVCLTLDKWETVSGQFGEPQELLFELNGARVTPHIATFGGTSIKSRTREAFASCTAKSIIRWLSSSSFLGWVF